MIYPLVEGKENQAKLIGEYKDDKLVSGVFTDDLGNIFYSKVQKQDVIILYMIRR